MMINGEKLYLHYHVNNPTKEIEQMLDSYISAFYLQSGNCATPLRTSSLVRSHKPAGNLPGSA